MDPLDNQDNVVLESEPMTKPIVPSDIKFFPYKEWRGPFFRGSARFDLPSNPSEVDLIIDVISHTEGRFYDSFNGYDSCRLTISPIQVCERGQYTASTLLGVLAESEHGDAILSPVREWGEPNGITFKKDHKGRWRFHTPESGSVDTDKELTRLVWHNSTGKDKSWKKNPTSKLWAIDFCCSVVNTMRNPLGFRLQRQWLTKQVGKYAFGYAKKLVNEAPQTDVGRAFVAALLSFCINNPSWANKHSRIGDTSWKGTRWTRDWFIHMMAQLTFGPKVSLYKHRWEAIRDTLTLHYGLSHLPSGDELRERWHTSNTSAPKVTPMTPADAQFVLRHVLFFDLGRSGVNEDGVDGVWGKKSREATAALQTICGLVIDGWIGEETVQVLRGALGAWADLSEDQRENITGSMKLDLLKKSLE